MNGNDEKAKIDHIDLQILTILQREGRITNAKLAGEVGLSAPPLAERIRKLERSGVIKGYHAILDAERIGCAFTVFVAINMDVGALANIDAFEETLRRTPQVLECHHIAGDIDFLLKINVKDQENYKYFVADTLSGIKGISRMVSWVVLHTSKETRELPLPGDK